MHIPIRQFATSMSGSINKQVHCENCGADYVFELSRHVSGSAGIGPRTDSEEAREASGFAATRNLHKTLHRAIEPVACPKCGWLQADMVAHVKKHHKRWLNKLSLTLAAIGVGTGLLFAPIVTHPGAEPALYVLMAIAAGLCVIAVAFMFLRIALAHKLDPNANYAERANQPSEAVLAPEAELPPGGAARMRLERGSR